MKLKKLLALTLAGVMTAATLTACTPLDAAELVYDSIFGGGSSSTGSGNNGSTGGNTGGTTGTGSTAEDAENRAVAAAYVESLKKGTYTSSTYAKIEPVYDIPHLEEFVKAIDEYCTKECETNGKSWEDTVHDLPKEKLEKLATGVLNKETYGSAEAWFQFGNASSGTPKEQLKLLVRTSNWFWDGQATPYHGNAWFDSVVLTRANGSKYRFLLSIRRG